MPKSERSPHPKPEEARPLDTQDRNGDGLSFLGEEGRKVAVNLARLTLGKASIEDLKDPRYSLTPDGAICLDLDDETITVLESLEKP